MFLASCFKFGLANTLFMIQAVADDDTHLVLHFEIFHHPLERSCVFHCWMRRIQSSLLVKQALFHLFLKRPEFLAIRRSKACKGRIDHTHLAQLLGLRHQQLILRLFEFELLRG
jgi:hypothetical protein